MKEHPEERNAAKPIGIAARSTLEFLGLESFDLIQATVDNFGERPNRKVAVDEAVGMYLIHMAQWGARHPDEALRLNLFLCEDDCGLLVNIKAILAAVCDIDKELTDIIEEDMRGELK